MFKIMVLQASADYFNDDQKQFVNLPMEGRWISNDEYNLQEDARMRGSFL